MKTVKFGSALVVEDEETIANSIARALRLYKWDVIIAQDPLAAIEFATRHQFDIIICDVGLPIMDGFKLIGELRQRNVNTQIILLSGDCNDDLRGRAKDENIFAIIEKPFDVREVQVAANNALSLQSI